MSLEALEMLIPSNCLQKYLGKIAFPALILESASDRVALEVDASALLRLIAAGTVCGIGSRSKIRRLRMCDARPASVSPSEAEAHETHETHDKPSWRAETNQTFIRQQIKGGYVFRHHPRHCEAFGPIGAYVDAGSV